MNTSIFETFGKYQLTERLALGGMAEVFLATVHGAAGFTKPVVIKRLHPRLNEDTEFVQMLIDEARITAQLTHTNICQVLDLGSVDGSYYLAMEFISGEDLRTLQDHCVRNRIPLPLEASIHIVSEMLAGLDFAHRKEGSDGQPMGIIHRDVSPQNVLISYEGEVKIIDFGIAKARLRLVQTEAGVIKGKFRYMAPEQASGAKMDHRCDVFAAGVVLYELLRGEPHSMDVADTEVLRRMRRAEFEPLRRFRPDIPAELEQLVKRALAVKPSQRYPSAGDFRDTLLGFLERMGVRFGRSEVARMMKEIFDDDRRRRRSGSFSGPVAGGRDPSFGTPPMQIYEQTAETVAESSRRQVSDSGWVAFAPTTAQVPDIGDDDEDLPPTNALDALSTAALDALPTTDLDLNPLGSLSSTGEESAPEDSERTFAYYALSDSDIVDDNSVPTAVDPREPSPGRTTSGAGSVPSLHREPTNILAGRGQVDTAPPPAGTPQPTLSTGFFARQAETVIGQAGAAPAASPKPKNRTLIGVGAVLAFGALLALVLYLLDRPLDLEETAEVSHDYGLRLGLGGDPGSQPSPDSTAQARRGVVNVQSQPSGAQVLLCGDSTGKRTPAEVEGEVGRSCVLELVLDGYHTYRLPVTPQAGALTTIVASLRRKRRSSGGSSGGSSASLGGRGILRITSIQVGTVYVENKRMGRTPRLDVRLMPGTYSVRVYFNNLDQYSRTRSVSVRAGETTRVHVDPAP